jgi:hypothetical protein
MKAAIRVGGPAGVGRRSPGFARRESLESVGVARFGSGDSGAGELTPQAPCL